MHRPADSAESNSANSNSGNSNRGDSHASTAEQHSTLVAEQLRSDPRVAQAEALLLAALADAQARIEGPKPLCPN